MTKENTSKPKDRAIVIIQCEEWREEKIGKKLAELQRPVT